MTRALVGIPLSRRRHRPRPDARPQALRGLARGRQARPDGRARAAAPEPRLHTFPVTTKSKKAQLFVNQGVNLAYGFNHAEAGRAFREAARLDPSCAMAYWGQAFVLGSQHQRPDVPRRRAEGLRAGAEGRRAEGQGLAARARLHRRGGQALHRARPKTAPRATAPTPTPCGTWPRRYPDRPRRGHDSIAESLMDLRPWNYWTADGRPYAETPEIVGDAREGAGPQPATTRARTTSTSTPWRRRRAREGGGRRRPAAEADARRRPHGPHAVAHLPARGPLRRRRGVATRPRSRPTRTTSPSAAPRASTRWPTTRTTSTSSGTRRPRRAAAQVAIEAARKTASQVDDEALDALPLLAALPGGALLRAHALREVGRGAGGAGSRRPSPLPEGRVALRARPGARRQGPARRRGEGAGRGAAHRRRPGARLHAVLAQHRGRRSSPPRPRCWPASIAAQRKEYDNAIAHLERAVRLEDGLVYTEPEEWHYPARQALGAVLLEAGRAREAETVYWDDLRRHADNGWSLYGLAQALRAQDKKAEAEAVRRASTRPGAART